MEKHKKIGSKISLFADKNGLPADVRFGKGSHHDGSFVPGHLKKTAGRRKRTLNLDKIYASVALRRMMRQQGTRINMETRGRDYTRKRGPKFRFDGVSEYDGIAYRRCTKDSSIYDLLLSYCDKANFETGLKNQRNKVAKKKQNG